ncbi:ROK family transcriptional regulator [Streptomyces sp. SID14478]|uniref:ROK family protein n=1 Tax=Streptomyces sp. SID14478 TaxID=2706073 RepID=UPI0013DADC21|nr:ROK family transcriptional regulator [Streptomyces sp. SID14478]NEB78881.1 ROK family transcriptional regulator [Streptomyces sp. SID14478]
MKSTHHDKSGDPSLLRRLNAAAALRVLRERAEITVPELAALIGVSRPTAQDLTAQLLREGRLVELEPGIGGVGRPARRFRFRAEAGHVVGVDIGAHKVLALATDLLGRTVAAHRVPVTPELPAPQRLEAVRAALTGVLTGPASTGTRPLATGIGTSGMVDTAGRVVTVSDSLPGWSGIDLAAELAGSAPGSVIVGNDIQLATLAEGTAGAVATRDDFLYLYVGNRLGIGLWLNGGLHRGHHGGAGEMVTGDGWTVPYQRLLDWFAGHGGEERPTRENAARAVVVAAAAGDGGAAYTLRAFARALAESLTRHVAVLDPQAVVLGGGISRAGTLLSEPFAERLAALSPCPPTVRTSTLGEESTAIGAARLALEHIEHPA